MRFPLGVPNDKRVMRHFNDPTIGGTLFERDVGHNAESILDHQPALGTFDQGDVDSGFYDHHGVVSVGDGRVMRSGSVRSIWPKPTV